MDIEVGKTYYKKRSFKASVRKVLDIKDDHVHWEFLHGSSQCMRGANRFGKTRLKNFQKWVSGLIDEKADFLALDGAVIYPTFIVLGTHGRELFRCGLKRAKFYTRKGFAQWVNPETLQLTNDQTENILLDVYGTIADKPFFMAVKNDRCVICGSQTVLTRHHVLPKRHKRKLPQEAKMGISNVVFTCWKCHSKYEEESANFDPPLTSPKDYILTWEKHFIDTMQPKFLPVGWSLLTQAKSNENLD